MENKSPGLNDRFASIEIDKTTFDRQNQPKSPRKAYPQSLYPQNYPGSTPSRAPVLSTARRAESRTLLTSKTAPLSSTSLAVQKRQLHRSSLGTPNAADSPSSLKPARQKQPTDLSNCSFMQQTSSSRKKQSSSERSVTQTRAVSHSEVYNRRPAQKKRQLSRGNHLAHITNKPDVPMLTDSFGDKPTLFCDASPSRHVSTAYTSKAKEDVYTRLYNTSVQQRAKMDKTRTPLRDRNVGGALQLGAPPGMPSVSKSTIPKSSSIPKSCSISKTANLSKPPTLPRSSSIPKSMSTIPKSASSLSLASYTQDNGPSKLLTLTDMYRAIYNKDPALFEETNSLGIDMIPNPSLSSQELLDNLGHNFSIYERGEVMRKQHLYYAPQSLTKSEADINISSYKNNYGFDDSDGNYIIRPNEQIEFRYEILLVLGTGSFGNVVLCSDHKYSNSTQKRYVAIKIIKNELDWSLQAVSEIKMLKLLSQKGLFNQYLLNYCDHFHFRGHMCIVTEVLSVNLYTFLEIIGFLGVSFKLLKRFATQILKGLDYIHAKKVIHCDIKPENIMIHLPSNFNLNSSQDPPDFEVRIIDFGSSCLESETSFSYIQSRFYRAPEVILGAKYSSKIDIWSFGCVIAEMFSGVPLLPGKTELEQIGLILELFGSPPSSYIVSERKRLMLQLKMGGTKNFNDPLVSDPVFNGRNRMPIDERKIKKTLLYSLFNLEGKINLQFLNLLLQSAGRATTGTAPSPFKRNVKLNSKSLEVALRLHSVGEKRQEIAQFSKFLTRIFQWDPLDRQTPRELLESSFLA